MSELRATLDLSIVVSPSPKSSERRRIDEMVSRSRAEVFANTREMLAMAETGLADATSDDPSRRRPGLMNLFTYGRSVTMAIQTMGSADPGSRTGGSRTNRGW
jgi:hypothetical protein